MPLPTPKTEAEREAKHLMKRLARLKHDWPSEPTLNNLSSLTVSALLKHIAAQDKVQATSHIVLTTMALLSLCGMETGYYRPFTLVVYLLFLGHVFLSSLRLREKRYATYALTQTNDLRVLSILILATRKTFGRHSEVVGAIKRLLAQVTEEHVGLLNTGVQAHLWKLAVEPLYTVQYFEIEFALLTLQALAQIGNRDMLMKMQRLAGRTGEMPSDRRVIEATQELVLMMEARLKRQQIPQTLLRAADVPTFLPDTLLRATHPATPEPVSQLLRAAKSKEREP